MNNNTLANLRLTGNFEEFRQKVESTFGRLEDVANRAPDIYAHMVLAHGFMEYNMANDIMGQVKGEIVQTEGCYDPLKHEKTFWSGLKDRYYGWAKENKLETSLLETGWEEFIND